jgi:methyltransferase-like protein
MHSPFYHRYYVITESYMTIFRPRQNLSSYVQMDEFRKKMEIDETVIIKATLSFPF